MNQGQFKMASEIFNMAASLSGEERSRVVQERCGDDVALREYVQRLLDRSEPMTEDFLAGRGTPGEFDDSKIVDVRAGTIIGQYKVLQQIGEGGFGAVFMAEQREPVVRKVALKIIKLGMDTKQVVGRFEAERQALAMMDHPNIARVLDGGATEDGRPYFVMELVRGLPVTQYCDEHSLSMTERLRLFIEICHAVQHAHQKGIIHRDIKPNNVMVTEVDGRPLPKVIDFGIAKAMHRPLTDRTVFTEFRQFVGTPEYMSPEQAEPMGIDVDTRSDIYSLGVLLYELLVGTTPFDPKRLRSAALGEIQRIICEEEPKRPSTRFSSSLMQQSRKESSDGKASSETCELIARRRNTDPQSLCRQLRRDLDWIVMKTLEKDRTRRYESAAILAMDVERYLRHEPVLASPPSVSYRMRKLIQRHRGAFAAGVIAAVAVIGGAVASTIGLVSAVNANADLDLALDRESALRATAEENADRADAAANEAERQAAIAAAVNEFLNEDLLSSVAPSIEEGRGFDVSMRDVLDVAARRIEAASEPGGRFDGQPVVEASIRATLGRTYNRLGEFERAQEHLQHARDLYEGHLGPDDERTLSVVVELGWSRLRAGDVNEAVALLEEATGRLRDSFGDEHPGTLNAMNQLALGYRDAHDLEQAELSASSAYTGLRKTLGDDALDTLTAAHNLGLVLYARGRIREAHDLFRRAVNGRVRLLGDLDPETDASALALAQCLADLGRWVDAEREFARIVELRRRLYGVDHPETINAYNSVASVQLEQGEMDEALATLREVVASAERTLGPDHPHVDAYRNNLAAALGEAGRLDEAEELYVKLLERARANKGADHPDTLAILHNLAGVYLELGRLEDAEPLYVEALEGRRRVLGESHPVALNTLNNLGTLYRRQGRFADALPLAERAGELFTEVLGIDHPNRLIVMSNVANVYNKLGRYADAKPILEDARTRLANAIPPGHWIHGLVLMRLGESLVGLGNAEEGEAMLLEGHGIIEAAVGADHQHTRDARVLLREVYTRLGRAEEAAKWEESEGDDP